MRCGVAGRKRGTLRSTERSSYSRKRQWELTVGTAGGSSGGGGRGLPQVRSEHRGSDSGVDMWAPRGLIFSRFFQKWFKLVK
jgi:hypothetical protein